MDKTGKRSSVFFRMCALMLSPGFANAGGFASVLEMGEMHYAVGMESADNVGYHFSCEPTLHFQFRNRPLYPTMSGYWAANSEIFAYGEYGGGLGLNYELADRFNLFLKLGMYSYALREMYVWGSINREDDFTGAYLKFGTKNYLEISDWVGYSLEAMAKTRKANGIIREKVSYQINVGIFVKLNTPVSRID